MPAGPYRCITLKLAAGKGGARLFPWRSLPGFGRRTGTGHFPDADAATGSGAEPGGKLELGLNLLSKFSLGYPGCELQSWMGIAWIWQPCVCRLGYAGRRRCARERVNREHAGRILVGLDQAAGCDVAYRCVNATSDYGDFSGYRAGPLRGQHRGFATRGLRLRAWTTRGANGGRT